MKPLWLLIEYESSSFLIPHGQDNVFFRDLGDINKSIVEIYVLDGPMRKQSWATIRANIEASRFRDEGIIIYPQKRKDDIVNIFTDVFEGTTVAPLNDDIAENVVVEQYYNKISNLVKVLPNDKPVFKVFRLNSDAKTSDAVDDSIVQVVEEEKMSKVNIINQYKLLDELEQQAAFEEILELTKETSSSAVQIRMAKRLLKKMQQISEQLIAGTSTETVLRSILDGVIKIFGQDERVAVMICGFDESQPRYYQFDPTTYFYGGTDKVRIKNMDSHGPPRPGRREGSSVTTMELRRSFFFHDVRKPVSDTPIEMMQVLQKMDAELKSAAFLPLMLGSERVGIIQIQCANLHNFTAAEKAEIFVYAQIAAIALYNFQIQKQMANLRNNYKALQEILPRIMTADVSQTEVLESVSQQIASSKFTDFYIASFDSKTKLIKNLKWYEEGSFYDVSNEPSSPKLPQGGLKEYVLDVGTTLFISGRLKETIREMPQISISRDYRLPKCYIGVPIKKAGEVCGIVAVQDFNEEERFDSGDKAMIEGFAALLSRTF